ncbi:MAG: hypothetical protein GYA55_03425 [SAR324 cluster bacterium]|uniref:Uncharacterized protein n=1 Tax=SAR324 cluster bacterium TaxID=2024889 RepID=A0A7X9FQ21_9DELT|nr:hypothetical protein [SAR324 cluster bacterium]
MGIFIGLIIIAPIIIIHELGHFLFNKSEGPVGPEILSEKNFSPSILFFPESSSDPEIP